MAVAVAEELRLDGLREVVRQRFGLSFPETRLPPLRRAVQERLHARGLGAAAYLEALAASEAELRDLLEVVVNQETSFFRHPPTFDAIRDVVLPRWLETSPAGPLTVWSAACSTGEEAYSLAMSLLDAGLAGHRFRVYGSDVSRRGLAVARAARYRLTRAPNVTEGLKARFFTRISEDDRVWYEVRDEVRRTTSFGLANLVASPALWPLAQDLVVCQNVLIYFDPETQLEVVRNLASRLAPGGFLVLGPGEVPGFRDPSLLAIRAGDVLLHQRRV